PGELATVIAPSRRLTAEERLGIYAHAYYARLLECLADRFPVLERALGAEVFSGFACQYLHPYPSPPSPLPPPRHHLPPSATPAASTAWRGAGRASPLPARGARPAPRPAGPAWPPFLPALARLEWAIARVFDGPGAEGQPRLAPEELLALGPERFAAARLRP